MLASRIGSFEGLQVADLFAGTGALGLEALSRGAAHCTFVEKDRAALDALAAQHRQARRRRPRRGARPGRRACAAARPPVDLVFLDPPYGGGLAQPALDRAAAWLAPGGWLSVELREGSRSALPAGLEAAAERRFGKATLILLRKKH